MTEFGSYSAIEASGWINSTPGILLSVLLFWTLWEGKKTEWCSPAHEWGDLGAATLSWCLTGSSITSRAGGTCRSNRLKRLLGYLYTEEHHQLFRINSLHRLCDRNSFKLWHWIFLNLPIVIELFINPVNFCWNKSCFYLSYAHS